MGPVWQKLSRLKGGSTGVRPLGGLYPTTPEQDAGMRIEPAMSDPVAKVVVPAASAAPAPPEDPPGVTSRFQGLRVTPQRREWVTAAQENSGVAVRAWQMAPARKTRSLIGEEAG